MINILKNNFPINFITGLGFIDDFGVSKLHYRNLIMGLEFIHEVGVEVGELNFRNLMTGLEFILGVGELNFRILILVFIDMC